MFTGIVEEVGKVASIRKGAHSCVLTVAASKVLEDVHLGDSIATNGVCLTVTDFTRSGFSADVMHETLNRSSLGALRPGSPVNLERAMLAGGRFGGHIVSGHIDGVGTVKSIDEDDNAVWYRIGCDASIIPHTRAQTNLVTKHVGDVVNLENDCVGKYVERLLACSPELADETVRQSASVVSPYVEKANGTVSQKQGGITKEFLLSNGF